MKATITKKNSAKRTLAGVLAAIALATAAVPTAVQAGIMIPGITASAAYVINTTEERDLINKYLEKVNVSTELKKLLNVNAQTDQQSSVRMYTGKDGSTYLIRKIKQDNSDKLTTTAFGIDPALSNTIYPGSLLIADQDMLTGSPETVCINRRPMEITVGGAKMKDGCKPTAEIDPSKYSSAEAGLGNILNNLQENADFTANTVCNLEQIESEEQIKAKLNLSESLWGELKVSAEADYQTKQQAVVLDMKQTFFTVSTNNLHSSDLLADDVTLKDVQNALRDENGNDRPAAYVSSVNYGKRVIACIQTDDMSFDLKEAVEASGAAGKVKGELTAEQSRKLSSCRVKLIVLGGSSENSGSYITTGIDELLNAVKVKTKYDGYAAPISFATSDAFSGKLLTKNYTSDAWETVITPIHTALKTQLAFGGISAQPAIHSKTINIYGKKITDIDAKGNYVTGDEELLLSKTAYADGTFDWTLGADVDFGSVRIEFLHDADKISNGTHMWGIPFEVNGGISAPIKQCIYLKNLIADTNKTGDIDTLCIGATDIGNQVGGITIKRSDGQSDSEYSRGAYLDFNLKYGLHLTKNPDDAIYAYDAFYKPQVGYASVKMKAKGSSMTDITNAAASGKIIVVNNY